MKFLVNLVIHLIILLGDTCKYKSVDNNKQENKFKNFSDDEIYAELKRRKANKSAK